MHFRCQTAPTGDFPIVRCRQHVLSPASNQLFLARHVMHFNLHVCNLSLKSNALLNSRATNFTASGHPEGVGF
jgi:hypothetical protein